MNEVLSLIGMSFRFPFFALGVVLYTPLALVYIFFSAVVSTLLRAALFPLVILMYVFQGGPGKEQRWRDEYWKDNAVFDVGKRLVNSGVFNPYFDMTEWMLFGSDEGDDGSRSRWRKTWRPKQRW